MSKNKPRIARMKKSKTNIQFLPTDLERIVTETFIACVDYHEVIDSTNDRALELVHEADEQFPLLVLAESQTAGRGRGTNEWWSSRGALTFSVLLATDVAGLPMERWPQVSLTVGLAVCEALEELLTRGVPMTSLATLPVVQLKWPNDVYLEGRKISGILVEAPPNRQGRLLLGIGINVNNSVAGAPKELQSTATALCDLTGRQFALTDVLIMVLQRLAERLQPDDLWNAKVREGWRERCFLTGKKIHIDLGVRQSEGVCQGIDEEGALLLDVEGEVERHFAGVVTLLECEKGNLHTTFPPNRARKEATQ